MERVRAVYLGYLAFFLILTGSVLAVPLLAFSNDMGAAYAAFSVTCHQKISRSLCVFSGPDGYWIADCTPQNGNFNTSPTDRSDIRVRYDGVSGMKMPVCSRDFGLYAAMLLGGLLYPLARKLDDEVPPSIFLIIALVPIGIDGGVQVVSELGILPFVYESTNAIRLATGAIAGFAAAFYAIPILTNLVSKDKRK
jgi:uncharacterized membrane protein